MSGSSRRGGFPARIGELLEPALERLGPRGAWTEARLRKLWLEAVGPDVSGQVHVKRLRGQTLEVQVDNDAWATEITYLAAAIVEKLNVRLGAGTVRDIVVHKRRKR
jgi:predicted nucleic acid-binding Zn ribbon protein